METKLEQVATAEERGAVNPHATFCGNRRRATASGDPVGAEQSVSLPRYLVELLQSGDLAAPIALRRFS